MSRPGGGKLHQLIENKKVQLFCSDDCCLSLQYVTQG
ncbi:hypothetical protein ACV1DV_21445 [Aeromonas veronii]